MKKATKAIALLATGDEIVNGDILNTNAQRIAQQLFDHQIPIGQHMVASDDEQDMLASLNYLLERHTIVITTGGLGPTSDDRTRFAVAKALNQTLRFDETSWSAITKRFTHYGIDEIPESNKQQALFPTGAKIYANPNGTAAGCIATNQDSTRKIIMLPGPPNECMPMFEHNALPDLMNSGVAEPSLFQRWLLFGIGEGQIAEQIEQCIAPFDTCRTGYRVTYPYLEFKLFGLDANQFEQAIQAVETLLAPWLINRKQQKASQWLQEILVEQQITLRISDQCTGGFLQRLLCTPSTSQYLNFSDSNTITSDYQLIIHGLTAFWQQDQKSSKTMLELQLMQQDQVIQASREEFVLHHNDRTCHMAAERACLFLLKNLFN